MCSFRARNTHHFVRIDDGLQAMCDREHRHVLAHSFPERVLDDGIRLEVYIIYIYDIAASAFR